MSIDITLNEVKKHKTKRSLWIVIHNHVYDVTKFLEEHPGGEDTLLEYAGIDGTQAFEDVGHSEDARELLKKYKIGSIPVAERTRSTTNCEIVCAKECQSCIAISPRSSSGNKSWRTYDGTPPSTPRPKSEYKKPTSPQAEGRVKTVVVPRERRRPPPPPPSGGGWKWAILALAAAIVIGFAVKKYAS